MSTIHSDGYTLDARLNHDDGMEVSIESIDGRIDMQTTTVQDPDIPDYSFYLDTPRAKIVDRSRILFNGTIMNFTTVDEYASIYEDLSFSELPIPASLIAIYKRSIKKTELEEHHKGRLALFWNSLIRISRPLTIIALALAHVDNPKGAFDLPLICQVGALQDLPLAIELRNWDGKSEIEVGEYTWYHAIALLLLGHTLPSISSRSPPSLISAQGWSIYLGSFLQPSSPKLDEMIDPGLVKAGTFGITFGVPWRNGVYHRSIFDGVDRGTLNSWGDIEYSGDEVFLPRCADVVRHGQPLYGERNDSFIVTLRLTYEQYESNTFTRRTGYAELFSALWLTRRTEPCDHSLSAIRLALPPNCATVSCFGEEWFDFDQKVVICLTSGSSAARWRVLVAICYSRAGRHWKERKVMLREKDCCFQCAIDTALAEEGSWFIVL